MCFDNLWSLCIIIWPVNPNTDYWAAAALTLVRLIFDGGVELTTAENVLKKNSEHLGHDTLIINVTKDAFLHLTQMTKIKTDFHFSTMFSSIAATRRMPTLSQSMTIHYFTACLQNREKIVRLKARANSSFHCSRSSIRRQRKAENCLIRSGRAQMQKRRRVLTCTIHSAERRHSGRAKARKAASTEARAQCRIMTCLTCSLEIPSCIKSTNSI